MESNIDNRKQYLRQTNTKEDNRRLKEKRKIGYNSPAYIGVMVLGQSAKIGDHYFREWSSTWESS